MIKRMAAVLAMVFAAVLGGVATPGHAASGNYCGMACNGENPNTYWAYLVEGEQFLCASDAYTAKSNGNVFMYGRTLQLRYSPTCRTVWGRVFGGKPTDVIRLDLYTGGAGSGWTEVRMNELSNGYNWGMMQDDAGVTIRACLQQTWQHITELGCTEGW